MRSIPSDPARDATERIPPQIAVFECLLALKTAEAAAFDPLVAFSPPPAIANGQDPLETKFDQSVIDYVNGTLLREQDTNGDGSLDKSEWVKGKWSATNPPENSDLNKDGKLSREELCIRVSKSRGIPIKGEQPQPLPPAPNPPKP
jgi:hypothetical protein